ncbi:MAG: hypothetical protein K6E22_04805 [Treponema sp.]|nr:hypothetical protein [Treponema sp.]MCR5317528.1 hypothetical protein [Treponema sp.]
MEEKEIEEKEIEAKNTDKLQKFDVPKYIKVLSVIFIGASIATGFLSFAATFLEQGTITVSQVQHIVAVLGNVLTGFLFWGIGQVFAKFMEKNK